MKVMEIHSKNDLCEGIIRGLFLVHQLKHIGTFNKMKEEKPMKAIQMWVFSLKPMPHKESGSKADAEQACESCRRILSHPSLHWYCCLECKVKVFSRKAKSSDPPFLAVRNRATANDDENEAAASLLTVKGKAEEGKRKKRKGNPQRAPLF